MKIRKQLSPRVIKRFKNICKVAALCAVVQILMNKSIFGIIDFSMQEENVEDDANELKDYYGIYVNAGADDTFDMSTLRRLDGDDESTKTQTKEERTWGGKVYCGKKTIETSNGFVEEWYDDQFCGR